ncbi:MAG: F-box protein [Candidatus Thorarchaeota archaeon]
MWNLPSEVVNVILLNLCKSSRGTFRKLSRAIKEITPSEYNLTCKDTFSIFFNSEVIF